MNVQPYKRYGAGMTLYNLQHVAIIMQLEEALQSTQCVHTVHNQIRYGKYQKSSGVPAAARM